MAFPPCSDAMDNPNISSVKASVAGSSTEENRKPSSAHEGKASDACSDEELTKDEKWKTYVAFRPSRRSPEGELDAVVPLTTPLLPRWYCFRPTDENLVVNFLGMKIVRNPFYATIIQDIDLYSYDGDELPLKEFKHCPGRVAYYFVKLEEAMLENPIRPTRSGYWMITETDKKIYKRNLVVGFMKTLVFYKGTPPDGRETLWIMHEYNLNPKVIPPDVYLGDVPDRARRIRVCWVKHKMEVYQVPRAPDKLYLMDEDTFYRRYP